MNRDASLLRWVDRLRAGELGDAELLAAFAAARDEAAFAELVRRHGPMVFGVCRRLLRTPQDAEDAYQATFIVLARRAAQVARPERLANWLYGVAYRTALEARRRARARAREMQVNAMPEPQVSDEPDPTDDLKSILDQELNRLPEKYRVAVVLCDLEGQTREAAARQLGVPVGTLSGRLTTAHRKLADRLARRGVVGTLAGLGAALTPSSGSAMVPAALAARTATLAAAATTSAGAADISPSVMALVEAVLRAMRLRKWSLTILLLVGATLAAPGIGLARHWLAAPAPTPSVDAPEMKADPAGNPVPPLPDNLLVDERKDLFILADRKQPVGQFFQSNRILIGELPVKEYERLLTTPEPWIYLPVTDAWCNHDVHGPWNFLTLVIPAAPPTDAVRRVLATKADLSGDNLTVVFRHDRSNGLCDLVGFARGGSSRFLAPGAAIDSPGLAPRENLADRLRQLEQAKTTPNRWRFGPPALHVIRERRGTPAEEQWRYQPPVRKVWPPNNPPLAERTLSGKPLVGEPLANDCGDVFLLSDRKESPTAFFRRQRIAVGTLLLKDYMALIDAKEPLELSVPPIAFNYPTDGESGNRALVRIAPPTESIHFRLFDDILRSSAYSLESVTVILVDQGDHYRLGGYSHTRPSLHFFDKPVTFEHAGKVLQRDLRYDPRTGSAAPFTK